MEGKITPECNWPDTKFFFVYRPEFKLALRARKKLTFENVCISSDFGAIGLHEAQPCFDIFKQIINDEVGMEANVYTDISFSSLTIEKIMALPLLQRLLVERISTYHAAKHILLLSF